MSRKKQVKEVLQQLHERAVPILDSAQATAQEVINEVAHYFCAEPCRGCGILVDEKQLFPLTVCRDCWAPFQMFVDSEDYVQLGTRLKVTDDEEQDVEVACCLPFEGVVQTMVHRLKYNEDRLIASDFARLMRIMIDRMCYEDSMSEYMRHGTYRYPQLVVPIPIHWTKRIIRGYNQSELICHSLRSHSLRISFGALHKVRMTKPQTHLGKEERRSNIAGCFAARADIVAGKRVALIDDVFTSGATITEAAKALYAAGAREVTAYCLARAKLARPDAAQLLERKVG